MKFSIRWVIKEPTKGVTKNKKERVQRDKRTREQEQSSVRVNVAFQAL
jgi:hypothetical protein